LNFALFAAISVVAIVPDAVLVVWGVSLPTIVFVTRYRSFKGVLAGHLAAAFTLASPGA